MPDFEIKKETLVGDVIERHPELVPILDKYFGGGCRTCPESFMETLATAADMHNCNLDILLAELNTAASSNPSTTTSKL